MFLETLATEEEKASFTRIYELYCSTMYHYALGILSNKEDAEDALHDAFCRMIKVLPDQRTPKATRLEVICT